jgi:hypothetical protein
LRKVTGGGATALLCAGHGAAAAMRPKLIMLSEPVQQHSIRSDVYTASPQWEAIFHRELDKDPTLVTMYDKNGKKVLKLV